MPISTIASIASLTQEWPYPEPLTLGDPEWETAFDAGDDVTRRNLTRAWMWTLHNEYLTADRSRKNDAMCDTIVHWRWFRKIHSYIDLQANKDAGLLFTGSVDELAVLMLTNSAYRLQERETICDNIRACWFGNGTERVESFLKIAVTIEAVTAREEDECFIVRLFMEIGWDLLAQDPANKLLAFYTTLVTIAEASSERSINTNVAPTLELPREGALWRSLASHVIAGAYSTSKRMNDPSCLAALKEKPVEDVAFFFTLMFYYAKTRQGDRWLYSAANPLQSPEGKTDDAYAMLGAQFPARKEYFDNAQLLGFTALNVTRDIYVAASKETVRHHVDLPESMTMSQEV